MAIGAKIVVAAVNLICLFVTLIYPNDATPFSLLPCWITAGTWLYNRLSKFDGNKNSKALTFIIPLSLLVIFAAFSCAIGFSCEYKIPNEFNNLSKYPYYALKTDAVFPFEFIIQYSAFQIFVFSVCFLYFVLEIVFDFVSFQSSKDSRKDELSQNPTQSVNCKIKTNKD